jgi:hypothetical protein
MMANLGTIMFLLFIIPLSWFIELRMAKWGTIMFLLFVIPLLWLCRGGYFLLPNRE